MCLPHSSSPLNCILTCGENSRISVEIHSARGSVTVAVLGRKEATVHLRGCKLNVSECCSALNLWSNIRS